MEISTLNNCCLGYNILLFYVKYTRTSHVIQNVNFKFNLIFIILYYNVKNQTASSKRYNP